MNVRCSTVAGIKLTFLLLLISPLSFLSSAELSGLFADGMVLQQQQPVPVWGWAENGQEITVTFLDQVKKTTAQDGKWQIELEPLEASREPAVLNIKTGEQKFIISDVLVGEVWVCGGQSNMRYNMKQLSNKPRDPKYLPVVEFIRNEVKTANDPLIRYIRVPLKVSPFEVHKNFEAKWTRAVEGNIEEFSGTSYFFAKELRKHLNVPIGLLYCNEGGTRVEPWIPMDKFQSSMELKEYYDMELDAIKESDKKWDPEKAKSEYEGKLQRWKARYRKAKEEKNARLPRRPLPETQPLKSKQVPSTLYNGMVHSVVPYAVKGAIWYQGESNGSHFPEKYEEHFKALIESWREKWSQEEFYFYWCQLANYSKRVRDPKESDGWATVSNAQRLVMDLPDTGMAVLNDIGEAEDIHPKNKADAGKRLSLWPLARVYGKELAYSGPLYKKHSIEGKKVRITFDHVGSGLIVGRKYLMDPVVEVDEPLKGFQICGKNREWKWASARITGEAAVEVWHDEISEPVEVRYAWSSNPEINLYSKEGLPTSIFKTD